MLTMSCDLAAVQTFSAIAIVEDRGGNMHLQHLERAPLALPHEAVLARVTKLFESLPEVKHLVINTGEGSRPVINTLRREDVGPLIPVSITSERTAHLASDGWRIPKRLLVSTVASALENRKLALAEGLPLGNDLLRQLQTARTGCAGVDSHDLALATAIAAWWAPRGFTQPEWRRGGGWRGGPRAPAQPDAPS